MIWLTWPYGPAGVLGAYGGTVVVCMVWRLGRAGSSRAAGELSARHFGHRAARDVGAAVRQLQCAADLPGPRWRPDVHRDRDVVFADIGGYVAGVLFGKHPMVPAISPKKSWEGLGGSLLFGITAAVLVGGVLAGQARLGRRTAGADAGDHRRARRPGRVAGQARPRDQGHGHAATRSRRHHGPDRRDAARRPSPAGSS